MEKQKSNNKNLIFFIITSLLNHKVRKEQEAKSINHGVHGVKPTEFHGVKENAFVFFVPSLRSLRLKVFLFIQNYEN
jgi:hypothetical protein